MLTCVIFITQEAEIRSIVAQGQPWQNEDKTLSQNTQHKKRTGRVVTQVVECLPSKGEALSSNPSTSKKKKKKIKLEE
jgi:hypothetical protein